MKKILITAPYMLRDSERPKVQSLLDKYGLDVTWAQVNERFEENELLEIISPYEGIICGDDRITPQVLDAAPSLKVIVKWGTGIDSICSDEALKRGIIVHRTPNAFTDPVADTTLGLMLAFCRGIVNNDRIMKSGGWDKPMGKTLGETTIGLIGFGDIGQAVAKRLKGFGSKILVNDIADKSPHLLQESNVEFVSKDQIYQQADIISLHCDLNATSRYLLNRQTFQKFKKNPVIINTARGPLIEEAALIESLKSGQVSGAGLDVFEFEPLPTDSPLRNMNHVLLASHNSNSSPFCWEKVHLNSVKLLAEGLRLG